jgi:hypothetical protein
VQYYVSSVHVDESRKACLVEFQYSEPLPFPRNPWTSVDETMVVASAARRVLIGQEGYPR